MSYIDKIPGFEPDGFEVGNVYVKAKAPSHSYRLKDDSKTYYMAISKKTLVTYTNGRFGKLTTKKEGHTSIGISVAELCAKWQVRLEELDSYLLPYFQPDEEARMRVRKEKFEEL